MPVDELTMILRIVAAAGLGLLVGMERESHGRAAGVRTCMLVAMAGALIMSLALYLNQIFAAQGQDSIIRLDPTRLPSYAIAGMGFLGAGVIIKGQLTARGVTTGAAMWTCTVIGLAMGAGLYLPALAAAVLTLACLFLLRKPAGLLKHEQYVILKVDATDDKAIESVRALLKEYGAFLVFAGRNLCIETDAVSYSFSLMVKPGPKWGEMLKRMQKVAGIKCLDWQEAKVP